MLESITLQPQGLTVQIADYTNGLPRVVQASGTGLPDLEVTNFWDGLNRLTGTAFPDGTTTSNPMTGCTSGRPKTGWAIGPATATTGWSTWPRSPMPAAT